MERDNRDKLLKKVPTRKLLASIKRDIHRAIRASAGAKKPTKK